MAPRRPVRHRAGHALIYLAVVWLVLALAWAGGLFWFGAAVPHQEADTTVRTDAIAVLTGGSGRLDTGLRLLGENQAEKLFVSGVFPGMDVRALMQLSRQNPRDLEERVAIGNATNTVANATETAEWMARQGYRSVRLVTSGYHMPRSLLEFGRVLPGDTVIVPHPVFSDNVKADWWAWPGTAMLIVGEYNKYLAARLRIALADLTGEAGQ